MPLGDADIEVTIGMRLLEHVRRGSVGHGSRDRHDARIRVGHLDEAFSEDRLIPWQPRGLGSALPRDFVERPLRMPLPRVVFCVRKALPLLRQGMDQHRALHFFDPLEGVHELLDVMAVDRTDVFEP